MRLAEAFARQSRNCAALGSPFMGRLMFLLVGAWPKDTELGRVCAEWPGDLGPSSVSMPLRIAGGLHALVLEGRDDALTAVYPPAEVSDHDLLRTVLSAMERHETFLLKWIESPPQTNEVRRSAVIVPAAHWIAARHPMPFQISELGASAGLNLNWDRFAVDTGFGSYGPSEPALTLAPDWSGTAPANAQVTVADRAAVDLNPLDLSDPEQSRRLFAYLWPDQPHRMDLTRAATAVQRTLVIRGDAIDWLGQRLSGQLEGTLHLIYHTIAWQYFTVAKQTEGRILIEAAGSRATAERPLAWLAMEADGGEGAGVMLRLWPGDVRVMLARADFHGRWVRWLA